MKPHTATDAGPCAFMSGTKLEELADGTSDFDINLESCAELDRILVRTRQSIYEMIVLSGDAGDVMVRGGGLFPEFQRATIAGSILAGSALKLRTICVGLRLEIHVNGKSFVTSRIEGASRYRIPVAGGTA